MDDLFTQIKEQVPLLDYVKEQAQGEVKKEGAVVRFNPCPLCGHRDCFTIYPQTNSFVCFSCQAGGDVIGFERLLNGLESNLEAARSVAEKKGICFNQERGEGCSESGYGKMKASVDKKPDKSGMGSVQARRIRKMAADFYHEELLMTQNRKALKYQTEKRGHSLAILKRFRVGFSGRRSIFAHAKRFGYSPQDLADAGLAKKSGQTFFPVIPTGFYVYPHMVGGEVLYLSIKDPKGKYKFQIKKDYADPEWVYLGQDALLKPECVIVEGENDFLSVIGKGERSDVACTMGNFNTKNILDFLTQNSNGRRYYLCFDRDEAGKKYTKKYGKAILTGKGEARVVTIPEPYKDIDEYLSASADPKRDFDMLIEEAEIFKGHPAVRKSSEGLYSFNSFEIIGETESGAVVFWSHCNSKLYVVTLKNLTIDQLCQLGGIEVQHRVVNKNAGEKQVLFRTLKKHLIVQAGRRQLGKLEFYGQGLHRLKNGTLLIVNGSQASVFDGKTFKDWNDPMIDRKLIDRNPSREWIDLKAVQRRVETMTKDQAAEILKKLKRILDQWGFAGPWDLPLVLGFFISQQVQQLWRWRPHLWIEAAAGSGKTMLLELFEAIVGALAMKREGQTLSEAGLRQELASDSRLVYLDEFEKSKSRHAIIEYLRSGNRGGTSSKGGKDQQPVFFSIRNMVAVCSVEVGLNRSAERSRFIIVELKKDSSRKPRIPNSVEAVTLRVDVLSYALWASYPAFKMIDALCQVPGFQDRIIDCLAVPLSVLACVSDDPFEELRRLILILMEHLEEKEQDIAEEDETAILQDIGAATIRTITPKSNEIGGGEIEVYSDLSVSQLIDQFSPFNDQILQAHGIRYFDEGIFLAPSVIERKLLRDTKWRGLNILSILKRAEGAEKTRRRIAGQLLRGVLLKGRRSLLGDNEVKNSVPPWNRNGTEVERPK